MINAYYVVSPKKLYVMGNKKMQYCNTLWDYKHAIALKEVE